jgi:hypothetical protein
MARTFIQVSNEKAVLERFLTKGDNLRKVITDSLKTFGKALQGMMAQRAPVGRTGSIRLGLSSRVAVKRDGTISLRVGEGKKGWKAIFFESRQKKLRVLVKGYRRSVHPELRIRKGRYQYAGQPFWRRIRLVHRPFIQPAWEAMRDKIQSDLAGAIKKEVEK